MCLKIYCCCCQAPLPHWRLYGGYRTPLPDGCLHGGSQAPLSHWRLYRGSQAPLPHWCLYRGSQTPLPHWVYTEVPRHHYPIGVYTEVPGYLSTGTISHSEEWNLKKKAMRGACACCSTGALLTEHIQNSKTNISDELRKTLGRTAESRHTTNCKGKVASCYGLITNSAIRRYSGVASHFHTFHTGAGQLRARTHNVWENTPVPSEKHWLQYGARKEALALAENLTALPVR